MERNKMEWKKLLTQTCLVDEEKDPAVFDNFPISRFERDFERIVSSPAFRRLQDKTQVFPLSKSDFVRTRLTHSLEVSTIAKQLGIMCFQNNFKKPYTKSRGKPHLPIDDDENQDDEELKSQRFGEIEAILSCAGLLHDLGNPPFGHVGEEIIRAWFKDNLKNIKLNAGKTVSDVLNEKQRKDLENFEGNAQALRILLKSRYKSEINLPYSIISALIKYPTRCDEMQEKTIIRKKMGCFQAENDTFLEVSKEVGTINTEKKIIRHPLAYLVEAADDIAYMTADLEDAVKSGIVGVDELLRFFDRSYEEYSKEYKKNDSKMKRTKEAIDKLKTLNDEEKDKTKVMSEWGTYIRRWLMYVVCYRFSKSYDEILQGTFEYDLFHDNHHTLTAKMLKKAMKEYVFGSRIITEPEVSAQTILGFLLDKFVPVLVRYNEYNEVCLQDKLILTLFSPNYLNDYKKVKNELKIKYKAKLKEELEEKNKEKNKEKIKEELAADLLYRRILVATDFISGMTDGYAKTLYKKMRGLE